MKTYFLLAVESEKAPYLADATVILRVALLPAKLDEDDPRVLLDPVPVHSQTVAFGPGEVENRTILESRMYSFFDTLREEFLAVVRRV